MASQTTGLTETASHCVCFVKGVVQFAILISCDSGFETNEERVLFPLVAFMITSALVGDKSANIASWIAGIITYFHLDINEGEHEGLMKTMETILIMETWVFGLAIVFFLGLLTVKVISERNEQN